ncbi:MAG: UDP-N-acetylmuramate:L-alanyl-gamma-D-glutamyl-meso-diaminopimelate ligase [Mariprofundaceae bacterium]
MLKPGAHIHILGVCGTAMAAIAALATEMGYRVSGSDAGVYPPMSDFLQAMGIEIKPYSSDNLNPAPDLVVIGNALSRGNPEVEAILDQGLPFLSGAEFIGRHVVGGRHAVVVAGTHGKTTSASLLAHVLQVGGKAPGFMIGGIPEDFGSGARRGEGDYFVLEGDEYDTAFFDKRSKFLHYRARTLILNNLEYDHADIFPDLEAIKTQFHHLLRTVPASGNIIVNADDGNLADVLTRGCWTPLTTFAQLGLARADWEWEATSPDGGAFRLHHGGACVIEASWQMIGVHNVANACAVAAAASRLGLAPAEIKTAFESFSGIRRRMTLVGEARGIRVFDDFAHHPTAIQSVVAAAKATMQASGRLWVILEPRSNTMRGRVHQDRLPHCFDGADFVIFVPPAARGMKQGDMLDVDGACQQIGAHARVLPDAAAIMDFVSAHAKSGDQVLILSNGGFEGIHQRLIAALCKA